MQRYSLFKQQVNQAPEKVGSVLHLGQHDFISSIHIVQGLGITYTLQPVNGGQSFLINDVNHTLVGLDEAPFPCQLFCEAYNPAP